MGFGTEDYGFQELRQELEWFYGTNHLLGVQEALAGYWDRVDGITDLDEIIIQVENQKQEFQSEGLDVERVQALVDALRDVEEKRGAEVKEFERTDKEDNARFTCKVYDVTEKSDLIPYHMLYFVHHHGTHERGFLSPRKGIPTSISNEYFGEWREK